MCRAEAVWTPLVLPLPLLTRCCVDGPFGLSWIPLLLQILPRSRGFHLEAVGAELLSVEVVVVAAKPEHGSEPDSEADFQGL